MKSSQAEPSEGKLKKKKKTNIYRTVKVVKVKKEMKNASRLKTTCHGGSSQDPLNKIIVGTVGQLLGFYVVKNT